MREQLPLTTTEAETRRTLIDAQLRIAGWNLEDPTEVVREYLVVEPAGEPGRSLVAEGPARAREYADYVLLLRGRVAAVVEAKRTSRDPRDGQEQALQYAQKIQRLQGGQIPVVLCANGHEIWLWESDFYPPTKVRGFPTTADLEWMLQRAATRRPLSAELVDTGIAGREYQIAAIRSVLEGMESKRRKFLLVMATGTGKTRTAMGLVDALLRARWAKRVLFLVDRIALRDQALEAFREHLPDSPVWPRAKGHAFETRWAGNRRLYCATYPTMANLIEAGTTPETWISPHFFDLVIADESHRSVYDAYKSVLDWFACAKLGLTATPTEYVDHDTFVLFERPGQDPTFAYTYEQAVTHAPPYLCEFEVLKVRSKFQLEGIKGKALSTAEQRKLVAQGKDPAEIDFEGSDIERKVTNSGTNVVLVKTFLEEAIKDPTGTLPGKTIVFAISKGHARRLVQIFDDLVPEHTGKLAAPVYEGMERIHGPGGLIDRFKRESFPRIVVSVDMLDTGVDVPEVVNLVFAKPVFSYTKFWQMIGRGTRLLARPRPWCAAKDRFLIVDGWGNFDFFKQTPKGREPAAQVPLPVRLFRARIDVLEAALATGRADVAALAVDALRADLATLSPNNAVVAEARETLAPLAEAGFWARLTAERIGHLRVAVAPVLRARPGVEEKGLRFEIETAELVTAMLGREAAEADAVRESLVEQVSELPLTVNKVAAEREAIEQALAASWWGRVDVVDVLALGARLAPLMRFRQPPRHPVTHLHLPDVRVIRERLDFDPRHAGLATEGYRARIEAEVRRLAERHPVMARIAEGAEPTEAEMEALAEALRGLDPAITAELLRSVYDLRSARLVRLLRHVLGLERLPSWQESVTAAFDMFVASHTTLTELQLRFLDTLKLFVLQRGRIERRDLVEAPFTQLHPHGVRGVFTGATLADVVALAEGLGA